MKQKPYYKAWEDVIDSNNYKKRLFDNKIQKYKALNTSTLLVPTLIELISIPPPKSKKKFYSGYQFYNSSLIYLYIANTL